MEIDYTKHIGPAEFNLDPVQKASVDLMHLTKRYNRLVQIRKEAIEVPDEYIHCTMNHAVTVSSSESRALLISGCENEIKSTLKEMEKIKRELRDSLQS